MLNLRDPKLTDQSLILDTATPPELYMSTVNPYNGSAVSESEALDDWEEGSSGQMPDNRMCFIFPPLLQG